ncbi:flavin reductase family protein [Pelagicoccus sp. SDUM812005]|uniref:flavin reductase family protein n=1 Tax=Pelagicoccus sp. SDUM812005 TaxID=3041257 RepID=UPI00280CAF93|nr:flavin reductase family protein [Pelagicoccus sp. SDUM812005]MDQ8182846.1 flavin reductase family protein [Pelagicoccus sp. SDUM812005]
MSPIHSLDPSKTKTTHEVLRQIPYSIFAVGIGSDESVSSALLASWVMQCSFEPPRIAVAIRKDSNSHQLMCEQASFTLNLLNKEQTELARILVKPHDRDEDKMLHIPHSTAASGAPVINGALAYLDCRIVDSLDVGDHSLFIGEVMDSQQNETGSPLSCQDIGWTYAG